MAGYGRLCFSINSGSFLYTRSCLITFSQNISHKAMKKLEKDLLPPKPKRPVTPFFAYLQSVREKLSETDDRSKPIEIAKKASAEWAMLDSVQKEKYCSKYNKDLKMYYKELERYENSITDEQKKELKALKEKYKASMEKLQHKEKLKLLGKPKKPMNSFLVYLTSLVQDRDPNVSYKTWLRSIKVSWKAMSEAEKERYHVKSSELMNQYKKDLEHWEKEMLNSGHTDVVKHQDSIKVQNVSKHKDE